MMLMYNVLLGCWQLSMGTLDDHGVATCVVKPMQLDEEFAVGDRRFYFQ